MWAAALLCIVYLLLAYGIYSTFTSQIPGGNDFYPRWRATRAFIMEGRDPYSEEVTLEIQEGMYGRPARDDEDQVAFAYPVYVSLLVLPFTYFSYPQAQALWISALVFVTIATVMVILQTLQWKPSPAGLLALSMWCLFIYPTGRSIVLGQFSIVVLALFALALCAMRRGWSFLAGCSLALSTIKPQLVFLLIPFLLLWTLRQRRYGILGGFLLATGMLVVLSSLLLPTWIPSFVTALSEYQDYTSIYREGRSPLGVLIHYLFPSQSAFWATVLATLGLGGYLIYEWIKAFKGHGNAFQALFLTMIVTLLVPAQTGTTNQVLLLLPIVWWLSKWRKRKWFVTSLSLILLTGPWVLFLSTVQGNLEHPIVSPLLPMIALAILWWKKKETDVQSRMLV